MFNIFWEYIRSPLLAMGGHLSKMNKVSVFIDGNNFYHGLKSIYRDSKKMMDFNFEEFINFLIGERDLIDVFYYNAELDKTNNIKKFESQKRFFDKLRDIKKLNLILCKLLKRRIKGTRSYYYVLKEDDIHMAVDMVEGAYEDKFDIAIIVSGDGDFVPAVKSVQKKEKKVENIYFKKSSSRTLKKHCNKSLELNEDLLDKFFGDN